MSAVAGLNDGATGWPSRATPDVADVPSTSDLAAHLVNFRHQDFPYVDARFVKKVLSGDYPLRAILGDRALVPDARDSFASDAPCPVGTSDCPQTCTSINVWGLSEEATVEKILSRCSDFGAVSEVKLHKPKDGGDQAWATVKFEERLAAQRAQASLHRTNSLQAKELRVGWESDTDEQNTTRGYWLYVWIDEGVTGKELYDGFRRAGAPCTDARVVRGPVAGDPEGIGALAFRNCEGKNMVRERLRVLTARLGVQDCKGLPCGPQSLAYILEDGLEQGNYRRVEKPFPNVCDSNVVHGKRETNILNGLM